MLASIKKSLSNDLVIARAKQSQALELEDFLIANSTEDDRKLAQDYIKCMFSDDYRRPTFVIATQNGVIIGAACYTQEFFTLDTWGVSWVNVHKDWRNQGVGQSLVEACLNEIRDAASRDVTVILATYPDKTRLYEKIGFVDSGRDHEDGSIMIKILEHKNG